MFRNTLMSIFFTIFGNSIKNGERPVAVSSLYTIVNTTIVNLEIKDLIL